MSENPDMAVAKVTDDTLIDIGGEVISLGELNRREAAKANDPAFRLEFRPDHKGRFDEIVARKTDMVHVEMMTDKSCYIGFYWDDGRYCQLWISSDKKLRCHHEDGLVPPKTPADKEQDHRQASSRASS